MTRVRIAPRERWGSSLRAERSNPALNASGPWIASSQGLLAMTPQARWCGEREGGASMAQECKIRRNLNVERGLVGELGAFLDEIETCFGLGAHQPFDRFFRGLLVFGDELDPKQHALFRVHGGFFQLRRHHLAEALEAADLDLGVGVKFFLEDFVAVLVVACIKILAAVRQAVERRYREIKVVIVDEFAHLPVEERDQQR